MIPFLSPTDILLCLVFCIEASNCGGVAVSGLEMAQNSQRLAWTTNQVDDKLKGIMAECYGVSFCLSSVNILEMNLNVAHRFA